MNANQILLNFANAQTEKELPGVYFLCGFDARRITAVSQQHRAISLVEGLIRNGQLKPETKVGVLGGGIAGCTFAYWAACHGAHVTIYEKSGQLLDVWDRASHRCLHPGLLNWPNKGWDQPSTNLPCLNWTFNTAQEVGRSLREKMNALGQDLGTPSLTIRCGQTCHLKLPISGRPTVDRPGGLPVEHDMVVIAVGNGDYPGFNTGPAYWESGQDADFFGQLQRSPANQVTVVGNGDGGIMDVLRMKTPLANERILLDFLNQWRLEDPESLERVESVVRHHEPRPGRDVTPWVKLAQAMGIGGRRFFSRSLGQRPAWQKHVTIEWFCKQEKLHPGASALLRMLLVGFMEAESELVMFREREFLPSEHGGQAGRVVDRVIRKKPIQALDDLIAEREGGASLPSIAALAKGPSGMQEADFFSGWYLFSKETDELATRVPGGQRLAPNDVLNGFVKRMMNQCASVAVPILPFANRRGPGVELLDPSIQLLSVHTMLRVVQHLDSRDSSSERLLRGQTIQSAPEPFLEAARPRSGAGSRLILMGDGGRGKTTLTSFLAYSLLMHPEVLDDLQETDPDVHRQVATCRQHWDGFLPVVVRLREMDRTRLEALESIEELVLATIFRCSTGHEIDSRMGATARPRHRVFESFREDIASAIQGRHILLVMDGMDEVEIGSARLLAALHSGTNSGLSRFRATQVIVTARTTAVLNMDRGWYDSLRWPLLEIEPLSSEWPNKEESQQHDFVLKYFRCLRVKNPEEMSRSLMVAVAQRGVSELAKEPLLLASFARLYARGRSIPATRVEVLHGIMDLLMDEWDRARGIRFHVKLLATKKGLSPEVPKRVLGEIASDCLLYPSDLKNPFRFRKRGSDEALQERLEDEFYQIRTVDYLEDALHVADAMAERFGILRRTDGSVGDAASKSAVATQKASRLKRRDRIRDPLVLEFTIPLYASCLAGLYWVLDLERFKEALDLVADAPTVLWDHVRSAVALGLAGLERELHKASKDRSSPSMEPVWPMLQALADKAVEVAARQQETGRELFAVLAASARELDMEGRRLTGRDDQQMASLHRSVLAVFEDGVLEGATRAAAGQAMAWLGDQRREVAGIASVSAKVWSNPVQPTFFQMGSKAGKDPFPDEQPQFPCSLIGKAYRLGIFPVTTAQFRMFEQEGYTEAALERYWTPEGAEFARRGLDARSYELIADIEFRKRYRDWVEGEAFPLKGRRVLGQDYDAPNTPVVGVSWHEAVAFCRWVNGTFTSEDLGLPQGWKVRLPTEAEWELAASYRGGKKCVYPWGNDPDVARRANCRDSGIGRPSSVGSFGELGRAECGAEDMIGNVWEWCSTGWTENYQGYQDVSHVRDELANAGVQARRHLEKEMLRVVRGGAWSGVPRGCRSAYRYWGHPTFRNADVGFRLAASPISEFWSL